MKIDRANPLHWLYLALFGVNVLAAALLRRLLRHTPDRRIVLYGHKLNGNLLALYRHLRKSPDSWNVTFLTMDPAYHRELSARGESCRLAISPHSIGELATADAIVTDHGLHVLRLLLGQRELRFIDVWHGIPFKGFDAGDFRDQHCYDEVWVASPLLKQLYVERFGFEPSKVQVTGYARTDRLVARSEDARAIRQSLGVPQGRKVVLFAPTWRQDDAQRSIYPFGTNERSFLGALSGACERAGATLLLRTHLNTGRGAPSALPGVIPVPADTWPDTEAVLLVSDVLICDWSSIAFDFLLLDRPTIFLDVEPPFAKGFSLGPEYRFGAVVRDLPALVETLRSCLRDPSGDATMCSERRADVRRRVYGGLDDGRATERCAQRLAHHAGPDRD